MYTKIEKEVRKKNSNNLVDLDIYRKKKFDKISIFIKIISSITHKNSKIGTIKKKRANI